MKKRTILLFLIFLALICVLINQNFIKYVYVSPQVNTSVLPYITKSIKPIERNFKIIMNLCQKEHNDIKYAYINYYGSGFLKENKIPNDLDVSVGVDLGTYEFDGTNSKEIAKDLTNKIESFHLFTTATFMSKLTKYALTQSEVSVLTSFEKEKTEEIEKIKNGLEQVLAGKNQVLHFNKKFKENDVNYTFILNENEVLANDMTPFFAYTNGIKYNKQMVDYPREITILPDFYATIKNTKTNEVKPIELIEESFLGERFQISRRFFVPIVFTGNDSLRYIQNLEYLNDDQKYIETRMFNYFRYLNEIEIYFEYVIDNVKLMKRLHQCADIILPALSEEEKTQIYSDISKVFSNKDIKLANDYTNSLKNLNLLTSNEFIFKSALKYGYLNDILEVSNNSLVELSRNEKYKKETNNLKDIQFQYLIMIKDLNSPKKLKELHDYLDDKFIDISVNTTKIINKNFENRQQILDDYKILKNIFDKAGFHKIEIYRFDLKNIYIVKDDFTKNLSSNDLKNLAKQNNMPNAEYKLIDNKLIKKGSRSELKYVRFNSSKAENEYWQELQDKLLQDKKNYKIKRKYIF